MPFFQRLVDAAQGYRWRVSWGDLNWGHRIISALAGRCGSEH